MRIDRLNRRMFLTGAGGAMLALPWLSSLLPRELRETAKAAPPAIPRRFVAIKSYNGVPVRALYPRQAPAGYTTRGNGDVALTQRLAQATGRHSNGQEYFGRWAPLSDFAATGISEIFGREFNPVHSKMTLFRGLDLMPNLNHNHGGFLGNCGLRTNAVGGALPGAQINVTIDQVMARSPNVYATAPVGPRVLHLGSRRNTCSYYPSNENDLLATGRAAVEQATAHVNPLVAFNATFADFQPRTETPATPSPSRRLVDRVIDDYRRARSGPHLGAHDRQTLERVMNHLSELEARLMNGGGGVAACSQPVAPTAIDTRGEFEADIEVLPTFWEHMVDIIVTAFACDVTRVVTLDVTKMVIESNNERFGMGDSENDRLGERNNWHLQAHNWDANAIRWLAAGVRWVANNVILRLVTKLDEIRESDGNSVLHHSAVLWGNELSFNHLNYSLPTAMWGELGGFVRGGRYIDYIDYDRPVRFNQHDGDVIEGVQYNRLLVTLLQGMGLEPSEYEREPGRGFGEYRPVDKGNGFAIDYDESNVGQILPSIGG